MTDRRWSNATGRFIRRIDESGLIPPEDLDFLAQTFVAAGPHVYWEVPGEWLGGPAITIDFQSKTIETEPDEEEPDDSADEGPVVVAREVRPPLRRWAAGRIVRADPGMWSKLVGGARATRELVQRSCAGVLDGVDGLTPTARCAVKLATTWPQHDIREAAAAITARREPETKSSPAEPTAPPCRSATLHRPRCSERPTGAPAWASSPPWRLDRPGQNFEGVVEAPLAPPVRLVVRFGGHVTHQLVEVVVVPEQDNAFCRGFGAEHRRAVEEVAEVRRTSRTTVVRAETERPERKTGSVFVIHGTKKFRDRVPPTDAPTAEVPSTTALGDWYATVLFWRPQVALFVNERTLLPVLILFAPAASTLERFRLGAVETLRAHGIRTSFVERDGAEMTHYRLKKTQNRSVLGVMNEFAFLADAYRHEAADLDLVHLSLRLAKTPCSPLYSSHVSPDRALAAIAG